MADQTLDPSILQQIVSLIEPHAENIQFTIDEQPASVHVTIHRVVGIEDCSTSTSIDGLSEEQKTTLINILLEYSPGKGPLDAALKASFEKEAILEKYREA